MSTLDDYVTKARAALEQIRPQLDELRVQADLAQGVAKERLQKSIAAIQNAQARAKQQLDQATKAGQGTWRSTAEKAEQALNDAGAQLQALVDQVQGAVGAAAPAARKAWTKFLDEWNRERGDREHLLHDG